MYPVVSYALLRKVIIYIRHKNIVKTAGTWLVDWLRVPTPMRAIRVRAWVEVVGFVMELFHFRLQ